MTDLHSTSTASPLPVGALVTVIGGAGFIGRYVVEALARAGYTNWRRLYSYEPAGVNLVGILAESGDQRFTELQAQGAARAARAAAAAGVQAYVQMSAIGADATSRIAYARSKGEGEQQVLSALPFACLLRPSLVAGPEDQFFNRFAGMARIAPFLPAISGDSLFQPVYVRDVADAVLAALQSGDARGRTFELGGPDVLSFTATLQMISDLTGLDRPVVPLSDFTSGLLAKLGDILPFMPMNSDQLAMLKKGNICAPGMPGLKDLGIAPTPLAGFIPEMMQRFRRGGRFAKAAA